MHASFVAWCAQRKLDAWSAQIAPFIAADIANNPPRYPPKQRGRGTASVQLWTNEVRALRDSIRAHISNFKRSVECREATGSSSDWDPRVSDPQAATTIGGQLVLQPANIVRFPRSNPAGALFRGGR